MDEITKLYRNVFGTYEGATVLSHMLYELGLFDEQSTDLSLKNYGSHLVNIIGYNRVDVSSLNKFIQILRNQQHDNGNDG